jgi:hypothetical protein
MDDKGNFQLKGCLIRLVVLAVILYALSYFSGGIFKSSFPVLSEKIEEHRQISSIEWQTKEVLSQLEFLNRKISSDIPEFRNKLQKQCETIKANMPNCTADQRKTLNDELNEIAATFVALDEQEEECKKRIFELQHAERALDRAKSGRTNLSDEYLKMVDNINKNAAAVRVKLAVDIEKRVGSGAIAGVKIQEKLKQIMSEKPVQSVK